MSAPEIRFPDFRDPWEPTVAGAALKHSRARGQAGLPIYSVTLDRGMVRRDSLDRHMEADAQDGQNLRAQPGDVVYNMMRMWQGAVGVAPEECMVSPAYVVLRPTQETNPQFFNHWFQTSRMLHKLRSYSHGLTKDRLRLYPDDFAKIPLHVPTRAEQDRIAAFLETIDTKLTALRQKANALRQFKTGLMQKIFSQELRFTREDGSEFPDWEEKPFSEIATRAGEQFDPRKENGSPIVIELENLESASGKILSSVDIDGQISLKNRFRSGDVLFGKLRPYLRKFARPDFDGVCSSEIWVLRGREGVSNGFLYALVQSSLFGQVANISSGSKMPRADWRTIAGVDFPVPCSEEQEKIASALTTLDAKIDAVTDQTTHMETFKKGLLQKMFV
ncbi:restriction endonuclease subunit S [Roseovarius tibetensis]|uniref:restriction endonuclease subunit S n=1 Tax=Roseovarius tibetensis TaxID=2685897 RepID=UPI003D8000A3